jgi:hypothetical protein
VIDHQRGVRQHVADGGGAAMERVGRRDLDPVDPLVGPLADPVAHDLPGAAGHDREEPGPVDVDERGRHLRAPAGVGVLERVLVDADPGDVVEPVSATVSSSSPTRRQISRRARSVSDARGAMCGVVSDHDPRGHCSFRHRQSRFAHTSTVGTPAIGRSLISTLRRPFRSHGHRSPAPRDTPSALSAESRIRRR